MRHIDAAEYVLGMLPADEMERGRSRELEDPAFAAEVRELRAVTGRLGALGPEEWAPGTPPALRLGEIVGDDGAAAAPERAPVRERRPRRLTLRPALGALGAAGLLAAGVGGGLLIAGSDDGSTPAPVVAARVALAPIGPAPAGARAVAALGASSGAREVTLDVRNLTPSPKGTFYEVWMARDARHMVSLGTFEVGADGHARVMLPVPVSPSAYPIMDVSLEPADGVPAHSSVSVLRTAGARLS